MAPRAFKPATSPSLPPDRRPRRLRHAVAARVLACLLACAGTATAAPAGSALPTACPPARLSLAPSWRAPSSFAYYAARPDDPPEMLAYHATRATHSLRLGLSMVCDATHCVVCPDSLAGEVGFSPSRIFVRSDLRARRCVLGHAVAHERRHVAVTRRAQALLLEHLRVGLAFLLRRSPAVPVPAAAADAEGRRLRALVDVRVARSIEHASRWAARENARIDAPDERRRESAVMRADCPGISR